MHVRSSTAEQDAYRARAAFYGLYLRQVCGYDPDEAAVLVMMRYPRTRPWLEKLARGGSGEPLRQEERSA